MDVQNQRQLKEKEILNRDLKNMEKNKQKQWLKDGVPLYINSIETNKNSKVQEYQKGLQLQILEKQKS